MATEKTEIKTHLNYEESREDLDRRVREIHGFSLEEYLRRHREGTLPDSPENAYLEVITGANHRSESRGS